MVMMIIIINITNIIMVSMEWMQSCTLVWFRLIKRSNCAAPPCDDTSKVFTSCSVSSACWDHAKVITTRNNTTITASRIIVISSQYHQHH